MPETPVLDGPLTDEVAADDLVLDLRQVVKSFGRTTALAGLDLSVRRGEVHAFLGPNGAGKTTTLRLLLGLLHADGGSMRVLGRDPWTDVEALHRRLAYVPGDVTLWPNLSGGEVIELLGRLRGGGVDPQRRDEMVARFDLDPTKRSRTYSKGNRQKVALVAALASNVDLYLLDEPTAGLDPLMEATFRDCVRELRGAGKTILLSSHILSEAEAVSDRVSLVRQGVVVETGTLAELRHLTRTSVSARVRSVPPGLDEIPGVHGLQVAGPGTGAGLGDGPGSVGAGTAVTAQVDGTAMSAFVGALAAAGIESLVSQPPTLEELFLRLYGRRGGVTTTAPGQPRPAPAASRGPTRRGRTAGTVTGRFAGTGALVRLALRRDRVLLPLWVVGFALVPASSVAATKGLYPSEDSLRLAAETINSTAALVALYGKVYVTTSLGAISLIKMTAFGSALVSILTVVLVARHSRTEEETGRLELVSAGVVGRAAPLAAALAVGAGTSLALGVGTVASLGLTGLPWSGAAAFGLGWALAGLVFSAVAAVAAQLTVSARAAVGLGVAAVGAAYALRAVGDLAEGDPGVLSWLSPIGWSQQLRPFAGDRWWVVVLPLAATAILVPTAFWLRARRDLGSGLLPDRAGPAVGGIGTAVGLAWRLQRRMLLAWAVGAAAMGLVLGSVAHNVAGMLDSAQIRAFFEALGGEQALVDMFLAAEVGLFGAIVSGYAIAATTRLRAEESAGHVELLLSTATTRLRWAAGHLLVAMGGTATVLLLAGAAIGLGHGVATDDVPGQVGRLAAAGAAQVPAAWVMASLVVLLFGWLPLAVPAAWGLLVAVVVLGEFGTLWGVPDWLLDLSPFAHSPKLPGGDVGLGQLVLLLLVAALLASIGLAGWRRRDLQA